MKAALVHYWLVSMRGGEKMLQVLCEMFPDADIYTHVYNPKKISETIKKHKVYTSFINKLPFARKLYQMYLPLMPRALLGFDLQKYDLVISSEAGPAKGVVVRPDAFHLCYCHSPMRYIWDMAGDYAKNSGKLARLAMRLFTPSLRVWDVTSSNLVDKFITNSNYSALRIRRYYRREALVVFGPADVEKYISLKREAGDFYLVFGAVTPYKRVDIAIEACSMLGRKLVIAGGGGMMPPLPPPSTGGDLGGGSGERGDAGITFTGRVDDDAAADLYSHARALLFPGIEDFGLVPIEAQAARCPVIAYGKGGVLDTVINGKTGLFFYEQNAASLADAILEFEKREADFTDAEPFITNVRRFSTQNFKERIKNLLNGEGFDGV